METKPPKLPIQIPAQPKRPSSSSFSNSDLYREESPHSPLRFHSPLRSDHGDPEPPDSAYSSPFTSPLSTAAPPPPNLTVSNSDTTNYSPALSPLPPLVPTKVSAPPSPEEDSAAVVKTSLSKAVAAGEEGTSVRKVRPDRAGSAAAAILKRSRREDLIRVGELGLRLSEVVFSLISFSIMAADKTQGWSGDSFNRYKEYRYCLAVNVIAFVYSLFQAYDLGYNIATGKHVIRHRLRRQFNFLIDQILAYLLISASSSAATRVDEWQSNWGKDKFTEMASASVTLSFLAFFAFAASCVISGYNLCHYDAT